MTTKFQKKIFFNISIIMLLFLAGLIAFFSIHNYEKVSEARENNLTVLSDKTGSAFSSLIHSMDAIALHIATNESIYDTFYQAQKEHLSDSEIYNAIKNDFVFLLIPVDTSRFRISVYNTEGNFISAGIPYSKSNVKDFMTADSYPQYYNNITMNSKMALSGFTKDIWSDSNTQYLSLYRELNASANTKKRMALIDVQCSYNTVDSILSLKQSDISTLLLDSDNNLIYSSLTDESLDPHALQQTYSAKLDMPEHKSYQDYDNLVAGSTLSNGWQLILIQSLHSPMQLMGNFIFLTIITAIICFGSALIIIFLVIKYNTKPLQNLTLSVRELSLSSPYLNIDADKYSDEMVNLTEAFNQMVNKLTVSMEENVLAKECELRANLIALQSQMDPHFLYNMLSVISSYDREEDFENIHHICIYMSSMLRYISSYLDNTATLEMELEHTNHYLQLMKFRFEDQFHYEITIDPELNLNEILVPRLILQPILENCFQHGFKKILPPWRITLSLSQKRKGEWFIDIYDNGCGFSLNDQLLLKEKIDSFLDMPLRSIESLKIGGMGLVNTLVRIQFLLKDHFHYDIILPPEGGTCIRLGGTLYDEHHSD